LWVLNKFEPQAFLLLIIPEGRILLVPFAGSE
jgi:hypothetical protein